MLLIYIIMQNGTFPSFISLNRLFLTLSLFFKVIGIINGIQWTSRIFPSEHFSLFLTITEQDFHKDITHFKRPTLTLLFSLVERKICDCFFTVIFPFSKDGLDESFNGCSGISPESNENHNSGFINNVFDKFSTIRIRCFQVEAGLCSHQSV